MCAGQLAPGWASDALAVSRWSYHFVNDAFLLRYYPLPGFSRQGMNLPAFSTFIKFAELKPDIAITLLRKHTRARHPGIQTQVWRMLTYIENTEKIPTELIEDACHLLQEFAETDLRRSGSLVKEIVRFLEKCATKNNLSYPNSIIKQMERYCFLPYLDERPDDTGT